MAQVPSGIPGKGGVTEHNIENEGEEDNEAVHDVHPTLEEQQAETPHNMHTVAGPGSWLKGDATIARGTLPLIGEHVLVAAT